jgi:putative FmdB family regulatory protein
MQDRVNCVSKQAAAPGQKPAGDIPMLASGIEPRASGTMSAPAFACRVDHSMPIYDFECSTCQYRFERLQKLADADPDTCPECGKQSVRRRLTAPAFRLSGSGWYETDFKKDGDIKRNLATSEPTATSETAKSDATKADAPKTEAPKAEPAKTATRPEPTSSS